MEQGAASIAVEQQHANARQSPTALKVWTFQRPGSEAWADHENAHQEDIDVGTQRRHTNGQVLKAKDQPRQYTIESDLNEGIDQAQRSPNVHKYQCYETTCDDHLDVHQEKFGEEKVIGHATTGGSTVQQHFLAQLQMHQ